MNNLHFPALDKLKEFDETHFIIIDSKRTKNAVRIRVDDFLNTLYKNQWIFKKLIELQDTPTDYNNSSGFLLRVNNSETAVEFLNPLNFILDQINDTIRIRNKRTINSSSDTGNQGEICWDDNYLYICINTNDWRRISLGSTF
jgi:hypothetical protein